MSVVDDGTYDLTDAGFDGFMSRSVDQTPQINLDSPAPPNFALPFDRTQVTGSQGDTFNMGGIGMNAKENTITLNDGTLHVNDTSTNSSIQASSGNITYFDSTGNLVVQEGLLPDGATGIRIVDKNLIGLAQFGRFKDGTTALKIAKPNIEVSTARNDQLVFNSSQDIFKIVQTDTVSQTLSNVANTVSAGLQTITIPHSLGIVPSFVAYFTAPSGFIDGSILTTLPHDTFFNSGVNIGLGFTHFYATADMAGLNINYRHFASTDYSPSAPTFLIRYYLLQETAN